MMFIITLWMALLSYDIVKAINVVEKYDNSDGKTEWVGEIKVAIMAIWVANVAMWITVIVWYAAQILSALS